MNKVVIDAVLFLLASPVLLVCALVRAKRRYTFLQLATAPRLLGACGHEVSLVGLWRCSCHFTYQGHLLRLCPVCGTMPRVVRCYRCGVTTPLPEV